MPVMEDVRDKVRENDGLTDTDCVPLAVIVAVGDEEIDTLAVEEGVHVMLTVPVTD